MSYEKEYRPIDLDNVIGHDIAIKSIKTLLKKKNISHTWMFSGPTGIGKTTIARIIGDMLDAHIYEINCSDNTSVNNMRDVVESAQYTSMDGKRKLFILDECHKLSSSAFNMMLKPTEEPPDHVFYILCSTEPEGVPSTIRDRCKHYKLKSLSMSSLIELLLYVKDNEKLKVPDEVIRTIAINSNGSARKALQDLEKIYDIKDVKEAKSLLDVVDGSVEIINLCRFITKRGTWGDAVKILNELKGTNPESIRIVTFNYLTACILKDKPENRFIEMLDIFSKPIADRLFGHIVLNVYDCMNLK